MTAVVCTVGKSTSHPVVGRHCRYLAVVHLTITSVASSKGALRNYGLQLPICHSAIRCNYYGVSSWFVHLVFYRSVAVVFKSRS